MICGGYQMRPALPYIPGTDAAGVVVACGDQVTRFGCGDRVCCESWFGSFAERMVAKASMTTRLPANVDFIGTPKGAVRIAVWSCTDRSRVDRRIEIRPTFCWRPSNSRR
jgi:threonine dehydrogenase-like Zn-dependent dehydrogenase